MPRGWRIDYKLRSENCGFKRPKNSGRKPGGQPGYSGHTQHQSQTSDITVAVLLDTCPECSADQQLHLHDPQAGDRSVGIHQSRICLECRKLIGLNSYHELKSFV